MPRKGNVWVVAPGESANSIAQKVYGKENERMFAEIIRLNGGVNMLRPGMVLRLPQLKNNNDIFISNNWAANMGMATSQDLQDFYKNNPGASATAAMKAGTWTPSGMGATGAPAAPKPPAVTNPIKPFVNSNAASPFQTPYGMQAGGVSQGVTPPMTMDTYRRQAGNKGALNMPTPQNGMNTAPLSAGGLSGEPAGVFNSGAANFGAVNSRPTPPPPAPAGRVPQGNFPSWEMAQKAAALKGANPVDVNNVATGQLPAGATVAGQQKPTTPAPTGNKSQVTNPLNYYANVALIPGFQPTQTLMGTPPDVAAKYAPYVNQSIERMVTAFQTGLGTFTKTDADLLFQAGILDRNNAADVQAAYDLAAGKPPSGSPADTGGPQSTGAGYWDPWSGPYGKPAPIPKPMKGGGGRGGGPNGMGLRNWIGSQYGTNIGPSLGLTQWRINL